MYSFFLPSQSPQGLIHFFSCKEFSAPYKVPAPNESAKGGLFFLLLLENGGGPCAVPAHRMERADARI